MAKSPLQAAASHHDDHSHHVHPMGMYIRTALTLAAFMGLTILAAQIDFGHIISRVLPFLNGYYVNNFIAVLIAAIKTYIVVMYFMHVKWSSNLAKMWAVMGFFFLIPLFSIWVDMWWRQHEPAPTWQGSGYYESALPRAIGSTDNIPVDPKETNTQNRIPKSIW